MRFINKTILRTYLTFELLAILHQDQKETKLKVARARRADVIARGSTIKRTDGYVSEFTSIAAALLILYELSIGVLEITMFVFLNLRIHPISDALFIFLCFVLVLHHNGCMS
jgi:hypothetical protein